MISRVPYKRTKIHQLQEQQLSVICQNTFPNPSKHSSVDCYADVKVNAMALMVALAIATGALCL